MNAIILSIGDELILGQTIDTNSAWLSQQLASVGCAVAAHVTVPDDQRAIENVMRESLGTCDFLIVTGGIGPTEDDLTRQALAVVMDAPLELNEAWLQTIKDFFQQRGRVMPETNAIQAMIPRGAQMIDNPNGTAAGIRADLRAEGEAPAEPGLTRVPGSAGASPSPRAPETIVFVMPGVPKEMKAMFARDVLPVVRERAAGAVILSRTLHTFGVGESAVAEMLGPRMMRDRNPSVGTTVSAGIVSLRVNARFDSRQRAQQELEQTVESCRAALGDLIYGQDDQTLADVVADLLKSARKTVTTAESCTGGLVAKMLTDIPGSSDYFKVGFITYSNDAKYERLGVPREIINLHGAVSEPVVSAMARHARRLAKADFALAVSGIAGPSGGSATKPVGTVCIALASPPLPSGEGRGEGAWNYHESLVLARTFNFPGDREWVRDRSAKMALSILRYHLLGKPLPF
jgi:nicotinamide-nucleotide amidase